MANIASHKMDFRDLDEAFFENSVVVTVKFDHLAAVGPHSNGIILVVFAKLGTEAFSVISMRPASRKERKLIDG